MSGTCLGPHRPAAPLLRRLVMSASLNNKRTTTPGEPPSLLLSAQILGKRLGVSVRTLWRLRSSGKLPRPVRLGGAVRWRSADIDAWVAAGCPNSPRTEMHKERCPGSNFLVARPTHGITLPSQLHAGRSRNGREGRRVLSASGTACFVTPTVFADECRFVRTRPLRRQC